MDTTITETGGLDPQGVEKGALRKVDFDATVTASPTVFKADDEFVIWGPASVEIVDKEGDKIRAKALSKALPQLLKRARLSLDHSDQLVGKILDKFETDEPVEVTVGDRTYKRSEFPTEVLELSDMEPALFVAGSVYGDTEQARKTRERIEEGELDSYSISGEALVTRKKIENGDVYDDIVDMDLSAVTLCDEGMNQKSKFGVIDSSTDGESGSVRDGPTANANGLSDTEVAASVAKQATESKMGNNNTGDMSDLRKQFSEVLDEKLPDGEIATKSDMEETARTVFKEEFPPDEEGEGPPAEDEAESEDEDEQAPPESEDAPPEPPAEDEPPEEMVEAARRVAAESEGQTTKSVLAMMKGNDTAGEEDDHDSGQHDDYEDRESPLPDGSEASTEGEEPADTDKSDHEDEESSDGDPPDEPEDGEVPPELQEGEGDEEMDKAEHVAMDQLEEDLPSDVWEVVREYVGDDAPEESGMGEGAGEAGVEPGAEAGGPEGENVEIEAAVKSVLKDEGIEDVVQGADAPTGEVESMLDKDEDDSEAAHGNNPALAPHY